MYRFFVSEENVGEDRIRIDGDDVNHIRNVLRMSVGERVVVSAGKGVDYECEIEAMQDMEIVLHICEERPAVTELPVELVLFQALPKKDKMELVIQKAVELGAAAVVPVRTKRCVVKLDAKKEEKKLARWRTIAEAAAKQSGRGILPEIGEVQSFDEALRTAKRLDTVLIPYELCEDMAGSVETMKGAVKKKSVGIFIGPEGGFERGEVEAAIREGAVPISLGKRILRTETAGMATLSVLMFLIEASGQMP
jgi:16S rRNA (uracil1498-N3)-methyltransferase